MTRTIQNDLEQRLHEPEFVKMFGAAQAKSSLALTLAKARATLGLTQKALAEKVGVSQAYIARLEGGEANPTLARAGSLLATLGLSLTTDIAPLSPYPKDGGVPNSITKRRDEDNSRKDVISTASLKPLPYTRTKVKL